MSSVYKDVISSLCELRAYVDGEQTGIMTHKMDTAIKDYMNMLTDELRTRQFTDEEIRSLIQISGIKECILKFPEESLHYSVESTADEVLQIVCKKAIERFTE